MVTADFFVCLDMMNMIAKFRLLPTSFVKDRALLVNSISEMTMKFRTGSGKSEMLQGWILIDRTINFIIKIKER